MLNKKGDFKFFLEIALGIAILVMVLMVYQDQVKAAGKTFTGIRSCNSSGIIENGQCVKSTTQCAQPPYIPGEGLGCAKGEYCCVGAKQDGSALLPKTCPEKKISVIAILVNAPQDRKSIDVYCTPDFGLPNRCYDAPIVTLSDSASSANAGTITCDLRPEMYNVNDDTVMFSCAYSQFEAKKAYDFECRIKNIPECCGSASPPIKKSFTVT